jgi:hypothetical protein
VLLRLPLWYDLDILGLLRTIVDLTALNRCDTSLDLLMERFESNGRGVDD